MTKLSHDSETSAVGQQVITACAFIYDDSGDEVRLFMPRRAATKKFLPDVFELPGGHIDFGEDIVAGLMREVHEEFGMAIRVGEPFGVFTYMNEVKGAQAIEVIYFAQFVDTIKNIRLNPQDHSEYRWLTEAGIDQITSPNKPADDQEVVAIRKGFKLLALMKDQNVL